MQKILLVTNIFPPHIGGPASFIDRLGAELSKRGYRVTVVCSSDTPTHASDAQRNFRVIRNCLRVREWYEIRVRLVLFWQMLRHRQVLVNGLEPYVAQIARVLRRRYVLKIVGDTAWETARNRGATINDIDRFQTDLQDRKRHADLIASRNTALRYARLIITPSAYLKRMVEGWGVASDQIRVILNGADIEAHEQCIGSGSGPELRVLFVGRITNWKGVETLLVALNRCERITATIAGDGPELPMIHALVRQLGLSDRVRCLGRVSAQEVSGLMEQSDALVLTSLYEGLSHTLLEAAAHGLPAVASDRGGNLEVIEHERNGLLVAPEDPDALRMALLRLRDDPELRARLGRTAMSTVKRFSLTRTVDEVCTMLIEEVAA